WQQRRLDEKMQLKKDAKVEKNIAKQENHVKTLKILKKLSYKEQKELDELPLNIENMESEKSDIEDRFCNPDYFTSNAEAYQKDQMRLSALDDALLNAYARWESLEEKQTAFSGV
ncbi:MAG: ABC transporter, partial [Mariprofundaceae bacterium]|nr:ABC transporter [Mariprofundaceae bacterium]